MAQPMLASIERTCPKCGTSNRILATEIKPHWKINCSHCGEVIADRRVFRPAMAHRTESAEAGARKAG